jgi:hypothetical protein
LSLHGLVAHRADTYQIQSPSFRISGKDVVARVLVFVRVLLTEHTLHHTTGGIASTRTPVQGGATPVEKDTLTWHNMPMGRESGVRPN